MKRMFFGLLIFAVSLPIAGGAAQTQDLSQIAKKTREQRMKVMQEKSVRIWNNDNLPKRPAGEGPTAAAGMSATPQTNPPQDLPQGAEIEAPPPTEAADTSGVDAMGNQLKQEKQHLKALEGRLGLAEDELSLMQVQQASELSPETQAALSPKIAEKTAAIAALKQDFEKAKKDVEKIEKDFKSQGGTLQEKKQ